MSLLNPDYPPILEGRFDVESITYGYDTDSNGNVKEYTLDNPLIEHFQCVYEQKNEYVSTHYDFVYTTKEKTKNSYGVWRKKLGPSLEFNGWECLYVDTNAESDVYILDPIKIHKNKVVKYHVYLLNVGTNTNVRSNQTSYICKFTGKKI
jgi:hypothetical protein